MKVIRKEEIVLVTGACACVCRCHGPAGVIVRGAELAAKKVCAAVFMGGRQQEIQYFPDFTYPPDQLIGQASNLPECVTTCDQLGLAMRSCL